MSDRHSASFMRKLILTGMLLGLGYVLPFLTGQIPQFGSMLLPMHLPVLICGFACGGPWGLLLGLVLPVTRSLIFGMPPLLPTAVVMSLELAAYGFFSGWIYRRVGRRPVAILPALLLAMLLGRIVWGLAQFGYALLFTPNTPFTWPMFLAGAFVRAWPGIVLQIVVVPLIVLALQRARLIDE